MSLFVGNISRNARAEDIEKEFKSFGPCRLKFKGSYAFIEYEDERDGEQAIRSIQNKSIAGRELNIEWSKNSGRYDPSKSRKKRGRSRSPRRRDIKDEKCFKCGHRGHFAYDCRDNRRKTHRSRHSRSHSRSRSRKYRKRSESRHRNRSSSSSSSDRKRRSNRKRSVSSKKRSNSSRQGSNSSFRRKDDKSPVKRSESRENKEDNNILKVIDEVKTAEISENTKFVEMTVTNGEKSSDKIIEELLPIETNQEVKNNEETNGGSNNVNTKDLKENKVENVNNESNDETYSKMKVDELKAELKKRNIEFKKSDRKQDLINLLKSNDTSK